MKLFGQLVRTAVNTALLPVAVAKDIVTLGGVCTSTDGEIHPEIVKAIKRLKDEAAEDGDDE